MRIILDKMFLRKVPQGEELPSSCSRLMRSFLADLVGPFTCRLRVQRKKAVGFRVEGLGHGGCQLVNPICLLTESP